MMTRRPTEERPVSRTPANAQLEKQAAEILRFARERIGPASEQTLTDPARQALVLSRLRAGFDLEDAVLAELHGASATQPRVADEFLAHFLSDLLQMGHRMRSSAVQRFLDTGDLVQSVIGDLWPEIHGVRFETRGRFLAYLAQRMKWKASDRARALKASKRREDRRVDTAPEELGQPSGERGPLTQAAHREDLDRLVVALMRLSEKDREILTMYVKGVPLAEMAETMGLSYDAARMALQRCIRRARRLVP